MAEELARYNVVLELLTELKNSEDIPKAVTGMKKEFQIAQNSFRDIVSKEIIADATKGIQSLRTKLGELGNDKAVKPLLDRLDELSKKTNLTTDEFIELEKVSQDLGAVLGGAFNQAADDAGHLTGEFQSAKKELRELTTLINSGQLQGEELQQATARAAALTDQIGDTREQIQRLSSDTRGIDTLIEGTRALTAGFALVQGATALFGEENEEVQKALVKLNAIMVIQNSLQEAHTLLLQNSNLSMKLNTISTKAYNLVVGQSTGALKVFKLALASTGIGLLVILLGALVANWDKVKSTVQENSKQLFSFAKNVALVIPGMSLLIKGIEYLYDNFNKLKFAVLAIPEAFKGFGQAVGDVLSELGDLDLSGALDAFFEIGEKTGNAYNKGFQNAVKNDINDQIEKLLQGSIKIQESYADRLDALNKDSFASRKAIILQTIQALELQGGKEQEIYAERTKLIALEREQAEKLAAERKAARDKALKDAIELIDAQFANNEQQIRLINEQELIEAQSIVNREERAKKIIEIQDSLNGELDRNERLHQNAVSEKRKEFLKEGTSDYINEQNKILENQRFFNSEFLREEDVFFQELGLKQTGGLTPIIDQLKTDLTKLKEQYNIITDPRLKEQIKEQIESLNEEIRKFNSPTLNRELFVNEGFDAIDITKLLPDQQIQALKDRLKLITLAQNDLQTQLKNGQLDPSELFQSDAFAKESDYIIELLNRLSGEFKKGLFGLTEEDFKLINDTIGIAKNAYDTITDIFKNNLDERIELQKERVNKAESIAEKGNVKQLELEEERLQKLEEERKKAADRQLLAQKAFAQAEIIVNTAQTISNIQLAAAKAGAVTGGIGAPIVLAILSGLIASAANLFQPPQLIEGIEEVRKAPGFNKYKRHNGQDGYTASFDGRERILNPTQNAAIGNLSNNELVMAALAWKNPVSLPMVDMSRMPVNIGGQSIDMSEIKAMRESFDLMRESFDNTKTKVVFDKNGLSVAVEKYLQKAKRTERFNA